MDKDDQYYGRHPAAGIEEALAENTRGYCMKSNWRTRLIHSQVKVPVGFRSLVTPVFRGSTTLFSRAASIIGTWNHDDVPYTYGSHGTPTTLELAARLRRTAFNCQTEGYW
jgi:cystathionine beta-lyase/cystathionine gamma-synthase